MNIKVESTRVPVIDQLNAYHFEKLDPVSSEIVSPREKSFLNSFMKEINDIAGIN